VQAQQFSVDISKTIKSNDTTNSKSEPNAEQNTTEPFVCRRDDPDCAACGS
jgi:hypothetical protein